MCVCLRVFCVLFACSFVSVYVFFEDFKLLNRMQKVLELFYNVLRSNLTLVCLEKNGGVMVEVMP